MSSSSRCALFAIAIACGGDPSPSPAAEDPGPTVPVPEDPESCDAYLFQGQTYDCSALDLCTEQDFSYRLACCDCDRERCGPDPSCPSDPQHQDRQCDPFTPANGGSCLETTGSPVPTTDLGQTLYTGRGQVVAVDAVEPLGGTIPLTPEGCGGIPRNIHLVDAEGATWVLGFDVPKGPPPPRPFAVGEWLSWRHVEVDTGNTALAIYDADDALVFLHEQVYPDLDPLHRGFDVTAGPICVEDGLGACYPLVVDTETLLPGQYAEIGVPGAYQVACLDTCDNSGVHPSWMAWPSP